MKRHRRWQTAASERLFEHPLLSLDRRHLEAGSSERTALVLEAPDWVNVIALLDRDPDPEVLLVRQWRFAAAEVTLEIPGGMVDAGESAEAAARRELLEETGYRAASWRLAGEVAPNPAILANRCSTWVARGLERVGEAEGDGEEELVLETAPLSTIPELIRSGQITHSLVVAAFYLLRLES